MEVTVISDTHGMHGKLTLPGGDVLIHCGDFTGNGTLKEILDFNKWLGDQDYANIIVIAGNHEMLLERDPAVAEICLTNCTYLKDSFVIIDGKKFYGSPWQPTFMNWAFNLPRGEKLKAKWDLIPDDIDVLITHGPPHMVLDEAPDIYTGKPRNVGCEELMKAVERVKPKFHCFGHIHEGYGQLVKNGTHFINASICDMGYRPINKPIIFKL